MLGVRQDSGSSNEGALPDSVFPDVELFDFQI